MWSRVTFGRWAGKSLPQVLVADPDWFFWACENNAFSTELKLQAEAFTLYDRARHIKIPASYGSEAKVRCWRDVKGRFSHIEIIEPTEAVHIGSTKESRMGHLDLSVPRQASAYDKLGSALMIRYLKKYWFGDARLTKAKVESFFSDATNFGTGLSD